jgi:hypothetical protein
MPPITGSFAGKTITQSALPLADQPNHQISIAEISGTQKSEDPLWNDAEITYWAINDLIDGQGTQHGYYNTIHGDQGRDWGTFEGKVTTVGTTVIVEGTYKFAGGEGEYRGLAGSGKFKTTLKSETELECNWDGTYTLAKVQTG